MASVDKMDKAHEALMRDVLKDVYTFGAARLPYYLLYRWFGAIKIGKNTWRKISELWDEMLEDYEDENGWQIGLLETGRQDEMTFFCIPPAGDEKTYIQPISARC